MKSLRTDDIIGASPRVRHMPKLLIRSQQQYYPYIAKMPNYSADLYESVNVNRNNNITMNLNDSNSNNTNYFVRQQMSKYDKFNDSILQQLQKQQQKLQSYNNDHIKSHSRHIKTKQAPLINYDQVQSISSQFNQLSLDNNPENSRATFNSIKNNQNIQGSLNKNKNYEKLSKSLIMNENVHHTNSNDNIRNIHSKRQNNIFRGLGFNIITNSKYQYNLQTTNPYIKKNQ